MNLQLRLDNRTNYIHVEGLENFDACLKPTDTDKRGYKCGKRAVTGGLTAGSDAAKKAAAKVRAAKYGQKGKSPQQQSKPMQKQQKPDIPKRKITSLQDIRSNKLNQSESKELSDLQKKIKSGEVDAYQARSMTKSGRVAEALTRGNIASGEQVKKSRKTQKTVESKPGTVGGLGEARRAEQQSKESTPQKKDYNPSDRIGSAAKLASGKPIKGQADFDKEIDKAFDLISKEKKTGDMIPIAALRDAIGDRVSQKEFDKYFGESSLRDGYQSIGGETSGALGYSAKDVISSEYKTPLGGRRFYLQRKQRKDSYIYL